MNGQQNNQSGQGQQQRAVPFNELDLQLMVTDPKWGDWNIPDELKRQLGEFKVYADESGEQFVSMSTLWGLLGYYTRDLRLGNLSNLWGEFNYCQEYLNFAGDCLRENWGSSFMAALTRVITILELSQSKGGFLRRRQGTLTTESYSQPLEPQKKGLFQGKNKQGGY